MTMSMRHFAITQRGQSHIADNKVCQDYSVSRSITLAGQEAVLAAISDGVGSCLYSDEGSRLAATTALDALEKSLPEMECLEREAVLEAIRQAYVQAYQALMAHATQEEKPLLEYDATLTVALFLADGRVFWGHVGDDGAVVMYEDGTYEMITQRHKGDFSTSVYPLLCTDKWSFGATEKPVAALAMMTDGVLDIAVGGEAFASGVYLPMLRNALVYPMQDDEHAQALLDFWDGYLRSADFRSAVSDDITLLVAQRPEAVAQLPEVTFDQAAWDVIAQRERERIEAALSRQREEWQRQQDELSAQTAAQAAEPVAAPEGETAEEPEAVAAMEAAAGAAAPAAAAAPVPPAAEPPAANLLVSGRPSDGRTTYYGTTRHAPAPACTAGQTMAEAGVKFMQGVRAMLRDASAAMRSAHEARLPAARVESVCYTGRGGTVYAAGPRLMVTEYGTFHAVEGRSSLMLLLLHADVFGEAGSRSSREAVGRRIGALCRNAGDSFVGKNDALAWPCDLLCDSRGQTVGYVLHRPGARLEPLEALWTENGSGGRYAGYDLRARLAMAFWVAHLVSALHRQERYVYDFRSGNFAIRERGMISCVRMDSLCFTDRASGTAYRPLTGTPEMLPPEVIAALEGGNAVPCNEQTDAFSLAVLIHMILCGGRHPFDVDGNGQTVENIRAGRSLYARDLPGDGALPQELRALFAQAFCPAEAASRPGAAQWAKTLQSAYRELGNAQAKN